MAPTLQDESFDGTIDFDATSLTAALTASLGGLTARSDLGFTCTSTTCTLDDGASIDVDGVGHATVAGGWAKDFSTLSLTITGADVMTATGAGSCVDYAIAGGATGQVCSQSQ